MEDDRRPTWSWPELVACFLLGQIIPAATFQLFLRFGLYTALYGAQRVADLKPEAPDHTRFMLWAVAAAFPFQITAVLGLLWFTAGVKPADLRLPGRNPRRQILAALCLGLVLIPAVYGVNWLALETAKWVGVPQREHGFTKLFQAGIGPAEWGLLVFAAVVVAPVWEELFFRGLVQPVVLDAGRDGELAALLVAAAVAFLYGIVPGVAALAASALCPLLPGKWRGLYAGAVLFAFVHSGAWPSPIPLLLLAVGLGWLARGEQAETGIIPADQLDRSARRAWGGLTGPIVLHALFNAVACALLLM